MPYELFDIFFQILKDLIKVPSPFQTDIITTIIVLFVVIEQKHRFCNYLESGSLCLLKVRYYL